MNSWQTLIDGIVDEDRILRRRLAAVQPAMRDRRGPDGALSPKEMLAHVAFWDVFTVRFFEDKLAGRDPAPPDDFARRSEQAIHEAERLSFAEVEAHYYEATDQLVAFVQGHWAELSAREQRDFWVPLKHRRHHRVALFKILDAIAPPDSDSELAAGA
ncbi:MAG: hypothetical protein GY838_00900 [bacterium]|nr:hypothetical protein [bacterium]